MLVMLLQMVVISSGVSMSSVGIFCLFIMSDQDRVPEHRRVDTCFANVDRIDMRTNDGFCIRLKKARGDRVDARNQDCVRCVHVCVCVSRH